MLIDHQGNGRRIRLVDPPQFRVRPDRAFRLVALVESDGVVGQPVRVTVRAEDRWGNPTNLPSLLQLHVSIGDAVRTV